MIYLQRIPPEFVLLVLVEKFPHKIERSISCCENKSTDLQRTEPLGRVLQRQSSSQKVRTACPKRGSCVLCSRLNTCRSEDSTVSLYHPPNWTTGSSYGVEIQEVLYIICIPLYVDMHHCICTLCTYVHCVSVIFTMQAYTIQ